VAAGAPLIGFDMDLLARRAASLITPILITNGEAFSIVRRIENQRIEAGAFLLELESRAQAAAGVVPTQTEVSREAILDLPHGLHARPAARVAAEAKRFSATVEIAFDGRAASASSPVAIMALGAGAGAALTVSAAGADAPAAVAAICALIEHGLTGYEMPAAAAPSPPIRPAVAPGHIAGLRGAPGLAIGAAFHLHPPEIAVALTAGGLAQERADLAAALTAVRARLEGLTHQGPAPQREIIGAHLAILDDHGLAAAAVRAIESGSSAGAAWRGSIRAQADHLRALADPRLAERADDLLDLERQVLIELSGEAPPMQVLPQGAIVLAHDLAPSQVVALPAAIAGLLTAAGGPTSHVAILAAARDIPAVVAAGPGVMAIADGTTLILDGDAGMAAIAPGAAALEEAQSRLAERHAHRRAALAAAALECRMADETRIEIFANLGSEADAQAAVENGAEGCGLLRTEFLFLGRRTGPGEDEQADIYQAIAATLAPRPLIIRTLDIGGDKPVPYLAMPAEENPALGVRGVRVGLRNPGLLGTQLAAILRVRPLPRIMVPMVASLAEFLAVKAMVEDISARAGGAASAALGVMIETPAAAVTADLLAGHADFLSVGTNDLSQYVLAMDRGNPALAAEIDALHPAVLRLIGQAVAGGAAHGRSVGVCGGLAADPAAIPILIGLGATSLSVPPAAVPGVKALVRTLTSTRCQDLAARASACASAAEVRALVSDGVRP
jgi:phosphocarrier protein FPr/phosphocarrier protein